MASVKTLFLWIFSSPKQGVHSRTGDSPLRYARRALCHPNRTTPGVFNTDEAKCPNPQVLTSVYAPPQSILANFHQGREVTDFGETPKRRETELRRRTHEILVLQLA
ncbi:hypothetical protein BKA80DRAFT_277889 [Phyllosticta citrichinensis]